MIKCIDMYAVYTEHRYDPLLCSDELSTLAHQFQALTCTLSSGAFVNFVYRRIRGFYTPWSHATPTRLIDMRHRGSRT